jgi:hypothetical protein
MQSVFGEGENQKIDRYSNLKVTQNDPATKAKLSNPYQPFSDLEVELQQILDLDAAQLESHFYLCCRREP